MDGSILFKFMGALLMVLAMIGGLAIVARRAGLAPRDPRGRGMPRRLAVVEVTPIDARRRLVLVQRDGVEHLLLLGAERDLVVEAGIAPRASFADLVPEPASGEGTP